MGKYDAERGEPSAPACGVESLLFDGYYLKLLLGTEVSKAWHARSGHKKDGVFNYSVERQKVAFDGPIPEGEFWIQPKQLKVFFGSFFYEDPGWGVARITIHPRPATETYSRGGFFIHGGKVWGSAGCIDLTYGMQSFADKLQRIIGYPNTEVPAETDPCTIPLTVKYATTSVGDP
jgi:hypothetical protein